MLTDMHNHTYASFDGKQSVRDVCIAAEKAGVGIIAVAEHFDCDARGGMNHFPAHFKQWLCDTENAKIEFEGKVQLLRGVEVGQPHVFLKEAKHKLIERYSKALVKIEHIGMNEKEVLTPYMMKMIHHIRKKQPKTVQDFYQHMVEEGINESLKEDFESYTFCFLGVTSIIIIIFIFLNLGRTRLCKTIIIINTDTIKEI